jgi:hypothetical protein
VGGLDSADAEDLDNPGAGGIDDFETLEWASIHLNT